jgi:hypothetical protein
MRQAASNTSLMVENGMAHPRGYLLRERSGGQA